MILQSSLIGSWQKLELWDHTHLALFGLLILVCVLEVILLQMTISAGLFTRPDHYDTEYEDSGEYEEDIYYEELSSHYDQLITTRRRTGSESPLMQQHRQTDNSYNNNNNGNNYLQTNNEDNNHLNNNSNHHSYHSTSTDVFRFFY